MNFDVIVLGSGPGGYVAAIRASQLGLKTAIVEKESLGGICLNWGCIPTKALLKSAQVFEYLKHSEDYGIQADNPKADFDKIIKRSRNVANGMSKGVTFLMKKNKITVINGHGSFKSKNELEVSKSDGSKETISAKHIIIATGARSRSLPNIPQDGKKIIGYREAMSLEKRPESMAIIGAGAIGVEFAYFYASLGTKVTVIEFMHGLVPREDKEISKALKKSFKKMGIEVLSDTKVTEVEENKGDLFVKYESKDGSKSGEVECNVVLSAVGQSANIENIGLETIGVKTEKGTIVVDAYYNTNVEGVYAIGDVLPTQALAHVASAEGITCVEKIAGHHPEPIDYENIPGCTYCSPEIASVGLTEEIAKERGYDLKIGKFPFSASGKASASGSNEGFVKVIYDAKYGELLGAHMIGSNVTEMIAEIVAARKLETTGHEILKAIHPHPTMSEAVMEATAAAYGEVIHL